MLFVCRDIFWFFEAVAVNPVFLVLQPARRIGHVFAHGIAQMLLVSVRVTSELGGLAHGPSLHGHVPDELDNDVGQVGNFSVSRAWGDFLLPENRYLKTINMKIFEVNKTQLTLLSAKRVSPTASLQRRAERRCT